MLDKKCPCYKCEERNIGCHADCSKYIEYCKNCKEIKDKLKWSKVIDSLTWK